MRGEPRGPCAPSPLILLRRLASSHTLLLPLSRPRFPPRCSPSRLQAMQSDESIGRSMWKTMLERSTGGAPGRAPSSQLPGAGPGGGVNGYGAAPPGTPGTPAPTPASGQPFGFPAPFPASTLGAGFDSSHPPSSDPSLSSALALASRGDHNGSLLSLLSAAFSVHPLLWLNAELPCAFEHRPFVEQVITRSLFSDSMRSSPEVRRGGGGQGGGRQARRGGMMRGREDF
jgi:hypothetical protein